MFNKYRRKWKVKINLTYITIIIIILLSAIGIGYAKFSEELRIKGLVTLTENGENPTKTPIEVTFSVSYYDSSQLHYSITVKNILDDKIINWRFKLGMPEGTKYQVWNSGKATIMQNYFSGLSLSSGASVTLTGNIPIPSGANVNDYMNPAISNILVNYYDEDYPIGGEDEIKSLTLNVNNIIISTGESYIITATREPKTAVGSIQWSSSNPNVVEVLGRGAIKGKSQGVSRITAKLNGVTAYCMVTVAESVTPIEVEFTVSNSWDQHIQYNIVVKNISNKQIKNWSFKIGVPNGTTGETYWGASFSNGVFRGTEFKNIAVGASIEFSGELILPAGHNVNNYTNPAIIDVNVE